MKPAVELLLRDALLACDKIARRIDGRDYQALLSDENLRESALWNLANHGEALNQAASEDDRLERDLPALRSIVGLRNRVIHGYRTIDDEIVWQAASIRAPELREQLARLLNTDQLNG